MSVLDEVRARVAERLEQVDGVVALRRTSQGTAPYLFRSGDDLNQLAMEPHYPLAPVVSLLQKRDREAHIGVVARGDDMRALVEMAKREQVDPSRVYIVAVACVHDHPQDCTSCEPVPPLDAWPHAVLVGTPTKGVDPNPLVAEYDALSREERRAFWRRQFSKCIKCYGCRNICPVCFCESCALEDPLWVEKGVLGPPFPMYHLIKAMHMASRCIACRQCELTCPAHIPLTVLYDLMRRDVSELLGYVPGEDLDMGPPLSLTLDDAPLRAKVV